MSHHCIVNRKILVGKDQTTGYNIYRHERGDDYYKIWNVNNQCQFFRVNYMFFFTKKDQERSDKIRNERKAFCKDCNYWWTIDTGDDDCHY